MNHKLDVSCMIGIYKITSPSGRVYIGQSWNIESRCGQYSRVTCRTQPKLYNSLKKYGWTNHKFEVAHELPLDVNQSVLDSYEQFYIDTYRGSGVDMLNLREAGARGKHSEESKDKISKGLKLYCQEEEGKEKVRKFLEYSGKSEVRKVVCEKNKLYWVNNLHPRKIPVYQYSTEKELIKEWTGVNEAADTLEIDKGNISKAINNKNRGYIPHYYKGYLWLKHKI